ncbi:hypothetical protein NP493_1939g00012 [Ridgeia piscesae]|uniref:Uncharacterized protein n=1 Tax=Ridgeia piscesae TaxID=27915 RepID=A0AAD9JP24_RIDPI|nr:hypothetical protein NP493_1939g00012 [Ridgeia piscesae]
MLSITIPYNQLVKLQVSDLSFLSSLHMFSSLRLAMVLCEKASLPYMSRGRFFLATTSVRSRSLYFANLTRMILLFDPRPDAASSVCPLDGHGAHLWFRKFL